MRVSKNVFPCVPAEMLIRNLRSCFLRDISLENMMAAVILCSVVCQVGERDHTSCCRIQYACVNRLCR